jgi:hypothetical protein
MDWQSIGARVAPALTILFGAAAAVTVWAVYRMRRAARTALFEFVRERSDMRAKRLLILAIAFLVFFAASSGLWGVAVQRPEWLPTPMPTSTLTLIPSPTPRTPTVTFTVTFTPTFTPTPTETPVPPDSDLPAVLRLPFPTQAVTPGPDAALVSLVLAPGQQNDQPVSPTTRFAPGTERVYAFLTFEGMARNVPWIHIWYGEQDGQLVALWSQVELWAYDSPQGRTWRYFNCRPGKYELHVYVGRRLQQKIAFVVEGG